jgi:hypothetical protein
MRLRYPDLEIALQHVNVLRDLFAADRSNGSQADATGALELLAGSFTRVLPDCLCQQKLSDLRMFVRALCIESADQGRWHTQLDGNEFLRLQVLKALNALEGRVRTLYRIRAPQLVGNALQVV